MFLARLQLNQGRVAVNWAANSYRVHQRLRMAYSNDPRLLFRIEDLPNQNGIQVIIQSHTMPNWSAFDDFSVLLHPPEHKSFDPKLEVGRRYRFRLLANPTVKKKDDQGRPTRLSLFKTEEQSAWLSRKLEAAGAEIIGFTSAPRGLQRSRKNPQKDDQTQTHFAVLFEGILHVADADKLRIAVEQGVGSAKGYGFGLLSLAPA